MAVFCFFNMEGVCSIASGVIFPGGEGFSWAEGLVFALFWLFVGGIA